MLTIIIIDADCSNVWVDSESIIIRGGRETNSEALFLFIQGVCQDRDTVTV